MKRIEYVDALRGFSMFLVVYSHIWTFGYHADGSNSFDSILLNFFLVLFFFVSGFVAYKKRLWTMSFALQLLRDKAIRLLLPAIFFCKLFCLWGGYGIEAALAPSNAGYWFTIHLFYFYFFYITTILFLHKQDGIVYDVLFLAVAIIVYVVSYSHDIIEQTQFGADLFHYLGMKNWRFYIFFCVGVLVRKHLERFKSLTDNKYLMGAFVIAFFLMVFYADKIAFPMWKPLNMLIYGVLSIVVIFTFFRKYEDSFKSTTKLGSSMQYIGRRTMDIYMIHYFLLPRNLNPLGEIFVTYNNPTLEFFVTSIIAFLVISLSLIIGNVVRMSRLLSHFLLGVK